MIAIGLTGAAQVATTTLELERSDRHRLAPHAIGGFFYPARKTAWGDIALATSVPLGSTDRVWGSIVTNLTGQPQNDVIGTVCLG